MTRLARAWFAALALVMLIVGAACTSSGPEPSSQSAASGSPAPSPSSPSESTSPTESASPDESATAEARPSPTLTPPTMPPEAEALDSSGATAFFTYWWEEYNYALTTGETSRLMALSSDECAFCQSFTDRVDKLYGNGGQNRGGVIEVVDASAPPAEGAQAFYVTAVLNQAPGETLNSSGETVSRFGGEDLVRADAGVVYEDDQWLVVGVHLTFKEST